MISAAVASTAFSALIWWVVPGVALLGAFSYVIWVSKFADKFHNETNRSVTKFQDFQESFRVSHPIIVDPNSTDESEKTESDQPGEPRESGE